MLITKVAFFAYGVSDIPRARKFYEGFLGLKPGTEFPAKDNSIFIEYDLPDGNTLAIGKSEQWPPSPIGASVAFEVDDLDEWAEEVKKHKVAVKTGPHDFPSCKMIVLEDPDGNPVCLHEKKK
jgi:predicted enzyme related to lactoylglutathione lyase